MAENESEKVELQPGQISEDALKELLALLREGFVARTLYEMQDIVIIGDWHNSQGQLVLNRTPILNKELQAAVRKASGKYLEKVEAEVRKVVPDMPKLTSGAIDVLYRNFDLAAVREDVHKPK